MHWDISHDGYCSFKSLMSVSSGKKKRLRYESWADLNLLFALIQYIQHSDLTLGGPEYYCSGFEFEFGGHTVLYHIPCTVPFEWIHNHILYLLSDFIIIFCVLWLWLLLNHISKPGSVASSTGNVREGLMFQFHIFLLEMLENVWFFSNISFYCWS